MIGKRVNVHPVVAKEIYDKFNGCARCGAQIEVEKGCIVEDGECQDRLFFFCPNCAGRTLSEKKKSADLAEVISGVRSMLKGLGIEDNEHTRETPYRVARAWEELLSGYFDGEPSVSAFESDYDEIVIVRDIEFVSICAHHMLPFAGKAHVGYLPNKKIVGLSKIPRIIEYFAKRLQVQEELAKQAAEYMMQKIEPRGVAVVIEAKHDCVACRGVKSKSAEMITSVMLGDFREHDDLKAEFLALLAGVKR